MNERVFFGECAVDIFVARIADLPDEPIADAKREEYIARASDPRTREERRAAWQLLLMGLKARGIDPGKIEITREECGRWTSPNVCFSLSHTQGAVAVAISDSPVGIDIEEIKERDITALSRRALTEREREELDASPPEDRLTRFYEIWCKKEAYFKTLGSAAFIPNKTDSTEAGAISRVIELDGRRLVLAVAAGERKLPQRKSIRLKDYNYSLQGVYFLTICTQNRRCNLSRIVGTGVPDCPQIELTKYGEIADKYIKQINDFYNHLSIEEYVIMPNHIHVLLWVKEDRTDGGGQSRTPVTDGQSRTPVPTGNARTNSTCAKFVSTFKRFCNKEYGENIWQSRYHDHIIRNREDYNEHVKYIYENPLRWQFDELYKEE